jgi:hypothetical protein
VYIKYKSPENSQLYAMKISPPSLPISCDLSVTEVVSTGILREEEESAILDTEQVHISHNAKCTH